MTVVRNFICYPCDANKRREARRIKALLEAERREEERQRLDTPAFCFALGMHKRVGAESSILQTLASSPLFDKHLPLLILPFVDGRRRIKRALDHEDVVVHPHKYGGVEVCCACSLHCTVS